MEKRKTGFKSIDEYIATFPEDIQDVLQQVRATIKAAAPDAKETIKYQMPTFTLKGIWSISRHGKITLGFYPPISDSADFKSELVRYEGPKGAIRFPLDEPMPLDLITRIVRFRVEEDLAYAELRKRKGE